MSGLYSHAHCAQTNKLPLRHDLKSLAEHLPKAYKCAHIGKWYLGDETIAQHGKSLRAVLEGQESLVDNPVVIVRDTPPDGPDDYGLCARWRTLIKPDGWKLNACAGDRGELYNLTVDPYEQQNRIAESAHDARIRDMLQGLRSWQQETGDTASLPTEPAAMR